MLVVAALLAVTACSGGADEPSIDAGSASAESSAVIPADQQFTLDDQAEFPDGLIVEIAGSFAQKATKDIQGAESTGGQIVLASVRIENNTEAPYDPAEVEVTASYGDGTQAPPVTDPTNNLIVDFEGPVDVSDEGVTAVGFAIPTSGLAKVTFVVDLHDDAHDPVSFTGKVERAQN
jgi:hypothetical protein